MLTGCINGAAGDAVLGDVVRGVRGLVAWHRSLVLLDCCLCVVSPIPWLHKSHLLCAFFVLRAVHGLLFIYG